MKSELPNEKLSELIATIYDCALDPQRWHATLETICAALDFCNSGLGSQVLPSGEPLLAVPPASTVRTHLLRLFAKTGTRRQAELVKPAASLAVLV